MFEKVNPSHPDKIADRIAGAIVDLAYNKEEDPKIAVEVLIGHGQCNIIVESNLQFPYNDIYDIVLRISEQKDITVNYKRVPQDIYLAENQEKEISCGDNGIFKGCPISREEQLLTNIVGTIYDKYPYDGKYIINDNIITACQSHIETPNLNKFLSTYINYRNICNPLGDWTGGIDVDCGATNRKLGSDMGRGVTGGGLHGKDLSKADVAINIYAHLLAQEDNTEKEFQCAIGDKKVNEIPYSEIVRIARNYINSVGGFEKFAEWGLIRPVI